MKIGIERYNRTANTHAPMEVYFNVPETGAYLDFLQQLQVKSYDRIWVDKDKQICVPCRMRKILTYQFGLQGVEIREFDE